jgi:hypothetical protein
MFIREEFIGDAGSWEGGTMPANESFGSDVLVSFCCFCSGNFTSTLSKVTVKAIGFLLDFLLSLNISYFVINYRDFVTSGSMLINFIFSL